MGQPVYPAAKAKARKPVSALPQLENGTLLKEAFSAWANVYDQQQNPLLTLEERYLLRLLPTIEGRDVLDVGCGTGRWIARLSGSNPGSLHGVDISPEMLSRAAARNISHARLSTSSCADLPVEDASVDLLLASFVLSYVDDLGLVARELARVAKAGCDLFLSDMHPETVASLHWKRSFLLGDVEVYLPARRWAISEILDAFTAVGFVERAVIEPPFGSAEEDIFAVHNKIDRFAEAADLPAIYLLHLAKPCVSGPRFQKLSELHNQRSLYGAQCALGAREKVAASVITDGEHIGSVTSRPSVVSTPATDIDLTGYLLFPGLVNAHDHLEFALFPRLGRGPYQNAVEWAEDIQQNDADCIARHRRISKRTRLWWGGIRNLLSGVTTVCHHNPIDPSLLAKDFPVRVVSRVGWEHSLPFGVDVKAAYENTAADQPFIIHACEGIDEQSKGELLTLDELGVLNQQTVLVHGLALDEAGVALLNARGSSLIVCPSSNDFLFGRVPSSEVLTSVSRLALGSDSPLTATGDLLDEIRFAAEACDLTQQGLYSLVTDSPISILQSDIGGGSIRSGLPADLIAVRDRSDEPAEILCSLSASDIELVLLAGRVQLASESIYERLPQEDREGLELLSVDGDLRWLRTPIAELLREAEHILGTGEVRLGGRLLCRP
jgi:cytosine/adenosine deaminase-related metal-dependent hydrolase/ubiquinone/menaquinone biosynthesis C-methylase UbiE